MKPRPQLRAFSVGFAHNATAKNLQCRRSAHTRAVATSLTCHEWHKVVQGSPRNSANMKIWTVSSIRHASTSTTAATKSQIARHPIPVPSKTTRTQVPAKSKPTAKPQTPIKASHTSKSQTTKSVAKAPAADITQVKDRLNPPPITYAPDLSVPARQPNQSFFKYVWNAGRAYLSFYKAGVSNTRQTAKLARTLREKASKAEGKDQSEVLTRAEWQIIRRSRRDMLRLPAFGLIFLVFGEWTPLLVMYITPLIPEPCRIPSQVKKQLTKAEDRRKDILQWAAANAFRLTAADRPKPGAPADVPIKSEADASMIQRLNPLEMNHYELILASARYNCHSRIFDLLRLTPPKFWLQRGVRKHFDYLRQDDSLIERDGGYNALDKKEVERACIERGYDVLNKKDEELRKALLMWYTGRR